MGPSLAVFWGILSCVLLNIDECSHPPLDMYCRLNIEQTSHLLNSVQVFIYRAGATHLGGRIEFKI